MIRVLAIALLLAGCTSTRTVAVPQPTRVDMPVPVSCVRELPARPAVTTDAQLARLPDGDLVLTLAAERLALIAYAEVAEAMLRACLAAPGI